MVTLTAPLPWMPWCELRESLPFLMTTFVAGLIVGPKLWGPWVGMKGRSASSMWEKNICWRECSESWERSCPSRSSVIPSPEIAMAAKKPMPNADA